MNALVCILTLLAVSTNAAKVNPVSRVVSLLESLSKQAENDGKKEEDLYESFVCWGKSTIDEKTAANLAANSRIGVLAAYIGDLEAGETELTTEKLDLTKEETGILADIDVVKANRVKESADFDMAKGEMDSAIDAMKSAIDTLKEATKPTQNLISIHQSLETGGMAALLKKQANLRKAVEFGHRFLAKGDALFLQRLLMGDVPKVDWKKLNRKAGFKMAYKKRSGGIKKLLTKMKATFKKNRREAIFKDKAANSTYNDLLGTKNGQLQTTQKALTDMVKEGGAKNLAKQESEGEVRALRKQIENDEKFIRETTAALATKKTEWKDRQELRVAEVAAFSQAISILHNDDARDQMKKSFSSQGYSFLQLRSSQNKGAAISTAALAAAALRKAGKARLSALADRLEAKGDAPDFTPIIASMDTMIALLGTDETKDMATKQTCEKERMENTKAAINNGRLVDEHTAEVDRLSAEIDQLDTEIKAHEASIEKANAEVAAARKLRTNENAEYLIADKNDEDAIATVNSAKNILTNFYADNNMVLFQKKTTQPGQAPSEAPATWADGGYGGKTAESRGIVNMLEMVVADMEKDKAQAAKEEGDSVTAFGDFEKTTGEQVLSLNGLINSKTLTMNTDIESRVTATDSRKIQKDELEGKIKSIELLNPDCEYFEVNFDLRRENRHIELDGLQYAKAILSGGTFAKAKDESREFGDSFLQKRK